MESKLQILVCAGVTEKIQLTYSQTLGQCNIPKLAEWEIYTFEQHLSKIWSMNVFHNINMSLIEHDNTLKRNVNGGHVGDSLLRTETRKTFYILVAFFDVTCKPRIVLVALYSEREALKQP